MSLAKDFKEFLLKQNALALLRPAPAKACPRCTEAVAAAATHCKFCTSDL